MKLYDMSLVIVGIVVGVAIVVGVVSKFFLGSDNAIEQVAERVIEDQTGQVVDLSPEKLESE